MAISLPPPPYIFPTAYGPLASHPLVRRRRQEEEDSILLCNHLLPPSLTMLTCAYPTATCPHFPIPPPPPPPACTIARPHLLPLPLPHLHCHLPHCHTCPPTHLPIHTLAPATLPHLPPAHTLPTFCLSSPPHTCPLLTPACLLHDQNRQ